MNSEPAQSISIAQDGPAEDRIREADPNVDGGGHGRIITVDTAECSIVAYVENGADAGELHEALASIWQCADDEMGLSHSEDGPAETAGGDS